MPAKKRKKLSKPVFAFFLSVLGLVFFNLYRASRIEIKQVKVDSLDQAINYWEQIIEENPTFRDGYLALAELENEKGNKNTSKGLLDEAKKIDPFLK